MSILIRMFMNPIFMILIAIGNRKKIGILKIEQEFVKIDQGFFKCGLGFLQRILV